MSHLRRYHCGWILALTIALTLVAVYPYPTHASARNFNDVGSKHWAAGDINRWNALGLIGGYGDGTFRPEQAVGRAEFLAFANRAFAFTTQAEVSFTDVSAQDKWFGDVAKAVAAGYALAYPDGAFRPNQALTRLEAGEMLYAMLQLQPMEADILTPYADLEDVTPDQRVKLNAVVANGYLGGFPDKTLRPSATLTRAQMIVILNRGAGEIYNQTGMFGPALTTQTLPGNATVNKAGITLRNLVINGDLRISEGIGEGEVYLKNVTVKGRTFISGGGPNCVEATGDTTLGQVFISDENDNVRLTFSLTSSASNIIWQSGGSFQSPSTSLVRPDMTIESGATGATISLSGAIGEITIQSGVNLTLAPTAVVDSLTITEAAGGSEVTVGGTVDSLLVAAPRLQLTISGRVEQLQSSSAATDGEMIISGTITSCQLDASGVLTVSGTVQTLTASAGLNLTVAGTVGQLQATARFELRLLTGGALPAINISGEASGSTIGRETGSTLGLITLDQGCEVLLDGKAQTTSGQPPQIAGAGGSGGGSGGGGGGGGGGAPAKQPIKATGVRVNLTSGSVSGDIPDGIHGFVDLSGLPDDAAISSLTFDAPLGTTLQLTSPIKKTISASSQDSLTVTFIDLLDTPTFRLDALRFIFGSGITVKGIASHPDYLDTEVTMTVTLN